ncbi:phosphoethanolamine transferase [Luteimonas granuli]|uniref:Lipid A phosphoethanolamine transferase n=1 Tax=Luteimonas granuli TaxID=1176533 RepID=A0A518N5J4_9GAMM|nr:phosphoethanolamine transferase [Luteimonas granuli]QDW67158.1 lipid A phosphoethanolamine transferase [Luteimonas granuli]
MTFLQRIEQAAASPGLRLQVRRSCILLLFAIAASPALLVAILNQRDLSSDQILVVVAASSFALAFHAALFVHFPRIALLTLLAITVLAIPQVWFTSRYGWPLDPNALSLIAETNIAEASDLVGSISSSTFLILLVPILLAVLAWPPRPGTKPPPSKPTRRIVALSAIGLISTAASATWSGTLGSPPVPDPTFPPPPTGQALALRAAYPASLPILAWDYAAERRALHHAAQLASDYRFGATPSRARNKRRIYVVVIGETARADHFGINGYPRETTPKLALKNDVISFTRLYSRWTFTRLSVPVIVSRKPPESTQATFHEASIVTAFKEAGFRTYWISLQAPVGYHESPTSVHAKEADRTFFLNPVDYRSQGSHDDAALPVLEDLINQDSNSDLFIVVHTLGSHFRYSDRYPRDFAKFIPDRTTRPLRLFEAADKEYLVNSYDNSILFTDHVLSETIDLLHKLPEIESWIFYVSDHGEALFDDCRQNSGHGQASKATQSVAALFWPSRSFALENPHLVANLTLNRGRLASTSMIFETLASLGGLKIPNPRADNDLTNATLRVPTEIADVERLDAQACLALEESEPFIP